MVRISFGALRCRVRKLDDSSRPDVVDIARVPVMLLIGLRTYQHPPPKILTKLEFKRHVCETIVKYQISWKNVRWETSCSMRTDRYDVANFMLCWPFTLIIIFVNKPNWRTNFVSYLYFYSLHVSGSHVPIIRRIIVPMHTRRSSTQSDINQVSHWYNKSPDDGHMAARNM